MHFAGGFLDDSFVLADAVLHESDDRVPCVCDAVQHFAEPMIDFMH